MCRNLSINQSLRIIIKHLSNKENSPAIEFIQYLSERITIKSVKIGNNRYFGKEVIVPDDEIQQLDLPVGEYREFRKMFKNKCIFKTSLKELPRSNNSCALTNDQEFIQVVKFLVNITNESEYTVCKRINILSNFSNELTNIKIIDSIDVDVSVVETSKILKLCTLMKVRNTSYISSIPNNYNYS